MNLKRVICVAVTLTLLFSSPGWAQDILQTVGHNTSLDGPFNTDYVDNPQQPTFVVDFQNTAVIETNPANLPDMYYRVANQIFNSLDPWNMYGSTAWDGPGYTSGLAASNATQNTTIGVMTGAQWISLYGAGTPFFGATVTSNEILMRYTYMGDLNLDGAVDTGDIANLIDGLNHPGNPAYQTYFNGDTNFDQSVDTGDIANLLTGLTTQGNELPDWTPPYTDNWPTGGGITPVPEPSTIVLLILACTIGLAARKKFLA